MTAERHGYTVVGAGAIGGTIAHALARAGHPVVAIDADTEHVAAIRDRGLGIQRDGGDDRERLRATTVVEADDVVDRLDRVLLAVKEGATADAASWIASRLSANGYVVSLQNGMNEPVIADHVGQDRTIGAFVDFFADVLEPGVISDGGGGALVVGELDRRSSRRTTELVTDLQAWGPARTTDNVMGFLWSKLGFSSMLAATALADEPMADVIDRYANTMAALAGEVYTVADSYEVRTEPFDGYLPEAFRADAEPALRTGATRDLVAWLRGQRKTRSGVWRDIAVRHRRTESVPRFRAVIAKAEDRRIRTPYLRALVRLLHRLESGEIEMTADNLDRLSEAGR